MQVTTEHATYILETSIAHKQVAARYRFRATNSMTINIIREQEFPSNN